MAMVEALKPHRHLGKMRNVGERYSTEDKMLLNTGFVKIVDSLEKPVVETKQQVAEADGEKGQDEQPEKRPRKAKKRNYRRRDMTAEDSQSKAL